MKTPPSSGPRIVVALDFPALDEALALVTRLDPARCRVKVGKELFVRAGPQGVEAIQRAGFEVFLDLKFHDIPNTVTGACRAAAELGVWMVNVHASGGRRMLEAAHQALQAYSPRPHLIAVTVLTSLAAEDFEGTGGSGEPNDQVRRLAVLAEGAGLDGVVCSAADLEEIRGMVSAEFLRVTPGIRPAGEGRADQRRVSNPAAAIAAGSSYLVVGRPITQADNPMKALASIEAEVECGLATLETCEGKLS